MNKAAIHLVRALLFLALLTGVAGCTRMGGGKPENVDYYTCTMHPSVRSHDPHGKCPICSMDLVPVMKKGVAAAPPAHQHGGGAMPEMKGGAETNEFTVPVERQQQIGVTYAPVERQPLHHTIRSVGYIVPDKSRHWEFVARVEGYVQKLYVTSPGEQVEEGQPLLTIYSPDLLTTSREFVNLLETRDRSSSPEARQSTDRLIASARLRLEQWNVMPQQIAELEKTRKPSEYLTLYSPFKGVVEDVPVDQGRKLMIGDHLVDVADLSAVWVWAEFYENELSMLKKGLTVTVRAAAHPREKFEGKIGLVNPFLNPQMRIGKVRVDIANPDLKLQPGMYVNVELGMDMGEGLTIPVSAVMPTGGRTLVFVDKGEGKLDPRFIELGGKFGSSYEVVSGLNEGEQVVSSANFLIDAESKVQGAVKSFEAPETEPGATPNPLSKAVPLPDGARPLYAPLIDAYLTIQKQLATDQFARVGEAAVHMKEQVEAIAKSDITPAEKAEDYTNRVHALTAAVQAFQPANLEEARVQFGKLSAALVPLLTEFPPPLERALTVMTCPMWEKSPAEWVQASGEVANPFMGTAMSTCGDTVRAVGAAK